MFRRDRNNTVNSSCKAWTSNPKLCSWDDPEDPLLTEGVIIISVRRAVAFVKNSGMYIFEAVDEDGIAANE